VRPSRQPVEPVVGERDAGVLGLDAVDQVSENPAAAAEALAVHAAPAVRAAAAGRDAGDQHAVPLLDVADRRAGGDHGADRLVAQRAPVVDSRDVALEDVQIGAADGRRVDLDDGVGGLLHAGIGLDSQCLSPGP
jgi:hypothetical protein